MLLFLNRRLVLNLFLQLTYQLLNVVHVVSINQFTLFGLNIAIIEIFKRMLQTINIALFGANHGYVQIGTTQIAFTLDGFVRWLLLLFAFCPFSACTFSVDVTPAACINQLILVSSNIYVNYCCL